jgi:hypothetical protein
MKRHIITIMILFFSVLSLPAQRWGGNRLCTQPLQSQDLKVIQGTVEELQAEPGKGMPTLVLKAPDGSLTTIMVGPYSAWLNGQFTVEKGDQVTVNAFNCRRSSETLAAVEIVNKTRGTQIALRDENGRPMTRGRGRRGQGGCPWQGSQTPGF